MYKLQLEYAILQLEIWVGEKETMLGDSENAKG